MKVTTKGQVTIPQHIRRFLGIVPHSEVDFLIEGESVVLVPIDGSSDKNAEKISRFRALRGTKRNGHSTEDWSTETRDSGCS
ncbi:AbrB/MazE/SpoVT family DNA-binding domain-containing protein [Verrucomicrobiales bacterium BCK34]|nr:AbrB/MazE/SpoVT family DNA-binding domain-containing protein [Verrucomicrobiales bacterium BCK34]